MEQNKKTELGPVIGIILVIILLLVGAFYFVGQRIEKSKEFQASIKQGESVATSSSDDINNIEKDAGAMKFDDLGSGINNL